MKYKRFSVSLIVDFSSETKEAQIAASVSRKYRNKNGVKFRFLAEIKRRSIGFYHDFADCNYK